MANQLLEDETHARNVQSLWEILDQPMFGDTSLLEGV